jgi:G-protein signaling modulator 2
MTIELLPEHLSKLDEMSALLRISQDCTIAFVRCNEPVLRDAVNAEIKKIVSDEVFIYDIKIDENSYNLLSLLNEAVSSDLYALQIKQNKKLAFFVFGLDKAIEKKNPDGKSEALVVLNMMREEFLKIKHVIIIWINSASLSLILKDAQDFFSWRTTVFEFDMPRMEAQKRSVEFEDTEFWSLTKKELEERWESYYGLLKEYREKRIEDAHKFAYWNYNLGMIRLLHGHAAEAQKFFEDSLNFSEKIMDKRGVEDSSGRMGQTYHVLGQVEKAIQYFEKALAISVEIGDRRNEGVWLGNLGLAYSDLGQVEKAIQYHEKALAISVEIGDRRNEGTALGSLGNAYSALGQVEKAIQYHEKALVIAADIGNRSGEGYQRMYLGYGYNLLNQTEKSIENYKQALAIAVEIGDRRGEGNHLNNIGFAFENEKKYMEALACYLLAREIYTQINDPNLRTTESNLNSLKEKLGEKKFEKLMAKTAPGAQEIVRKILEGASD